MISLTRSRIAASNPSRREPSWPTSIAVLVFAMAYSSCALNLSQRFRAFSFTDFSGEYAFYFSTGIGTEPPRIAQVQSTRPSRFAGHLAREAHKLFLADAFVTPRRNSVSLALEHDVLIVTQSVCP